MGLMSPLGESSFSKIELGLGAAASALLIHQLWENRNELFSSGLYSAQYQPLSGLTNYTNLCYVNSLLQLIASMPNYIDFLVKIEQKFGLQSEKTIISKLIEVLKRINTKCERGSKFDGAAIIVNQMQKTARWNSFVQQDTSEFWTVLENLVEQECRNSMGENCLLNMQPTSFLSPFKWPSHFSTIRQMQCTACGEKKEDRVENLHLLQLEQRPFLFNVPSATFKTDLERSLEDYFKTETLVVNCEKCANPNAQKTMMASTFDSSPEMKMSDTAHQKSVSFATLPPYLSILVNAQWDPYTGNSFRSAQRWTYPEFLELSKFCYTTKLRGVPTSQKSYELQAVVVHIGTGNCGHYVTTRKVNDSWYQCNDRSVGPIPTGLNHHGAYILLYSRMGQ